MKEKMSIIPFHPLSEQQIITQEICKTPSQVRKSIENGECDNMFERIVKIFKRELRKYLEENPEVSVYIQQEIHLTPGEIDCLKTHSGKTLRDLVLHDPNVAETLSVLFRNFITSVHPDLITATAQMAREKNYSDKELREYDEKFMAEQVQKEISLAVGIMNQFSNELSKDIVEKRSNMPQLSPDELINLIRKIFANISDVVDKKMIETLEKNGCFNNPQVVFQFLTDPQLYKKHVNGRAEVIQYFLEKMHDGSNVGELYFLQTEKNKFYFFNNQALPIMFKNKPLAHNMPFESDEKNIELIDGVAHIRLEASGKNKKITIDTEGAFAFENEQIIGTIHNTTRISIYKLSNGSQYVSYSEKDSQGKERFIRDDTGKPLEFEELESNSCHNILKGYALLRNKRQWYKIIFPLEEKALELETIQEI
jgi:hypothetical protein